MSSVPQHLREHRRAGTAGPAWGPRHRPFGPAAFWFFITVGFVVAILHAL